MFKNRLTLGLLCIASVASAQVGVIGKDTAQQAPAGRYILTAMNDTVYFRPSGGVKKALTSRVDFLAGLAGKEDAFSKNTAFNKNFGTASGTVAQGNHSHAFSTLTSKPNTISGYGITDFNTTANTWISGKLTPLGDGSILSQSYGTLTAVEGVNTYLRIVSGAPGYPPNPDIYYRGLTASVFNITKGFTVSDSFGEDGQILHSGGENGVAKWAYVIDTLGGRPILPLSPQAAYLLPEDHHLVIEPDYIPSRSSGNSYFDTLRADCFFYNILKDSVELKLTDFDTLFNSNMTFHILFFGSDHSDSLFIHDSNSILYFSDTVYADVGGTIFKSNYLSSSHSLSYFRVAPFQSLQLYWVRDERKYYINKKQSYEYNY